MPPQFLDRLKCSLLALWRRADAFFATLAGKLAAWAAAAVLITQMVVMAPALGDFHETWLRDRINLAQTAALALEAAPGVAIAEPLQTELLENAEVKRVAMKRDGERELLLEQPFDANPGPLAVYDYTQAGALTRWGWAMQTFFAPDGRILRVLARPRFESGEFIEIVLNEAPLKRDMYVFARGAAVISTLLSLLGVVIGYMALRLAVVRPIETLSRSIERFRDRPEDASIAFPHSARRDEIGQIERSAAEMAEQIRASLRQRERLAQLGAAVARIGHDLRNMLTTAQLVSERLGQSEDARVRQIAPRLERAIGRAAGLAATTLRFGRADEASPVLAPVRAAEAARDAAQDALAGFAQIGAEVAITEDIVLIADPEHLHRILVNLIRNAAQAISARPGANAGVILRAERRSGAVALMVEDCGPGVPERLRETLFDAFVTAGRGGAGSGLGLAIARDLARMMGGDVVMAQSSSAGAVFEVLLPAG